ncbi:MAG: MarR family transcriptional regulator [Ruminococcus sp.]|nr:MarR family transcriptional regulator [Ruminococcus sp.]
MKYLTELLESGEMFGEKRVPCELYGKLLRDMQRHMALCRAIISSDCASQSEIILIHCALDYAEENGGENITVAQAAKNLGASLPSVSRTLRSLSQKGFVERYSDPNDRRTVRIRVTEQGENELKRLLRRIFSVFDGAMRGFSDEEISTMIELHGRFVEATSKIIASERGT